MSDSFVWVRPATESNRVKVKTEKIGDVELPTYVQTDGDGTLISGANPLPTEIYDSDGNPVYVDQFTGAIGSIDQEHLQIHNGNGYTIADRVLILNGGGVLDLLGIVPAATFPHFRQIQVASSGGPFDIDFYEGTTVSANGTEITAYNNNRNSSNTPDLVTYSGPTVTDDGDLLETVYVPGTKQTGSLGSEGSNEWLLKPSTNYMIRITNNTSGGGTSIFVTNIFWYEG